MGANDGIIRTFAVVTSVEGANLGTKAILIVGFASLFADGFSMATSGFLAHKAEAARKENDGEKGGQGKENPKVAAFFTFLAFVLVGIIPLVPYFIPGNTSSVTFAISGVATACALFAVGALRTKVTGGNAFKAGIEMLLVGGSAAVVAYLVGKMVKQWQ